VQTAIVHQRYGLSEYEADAIQQRRERKLMRRATSMGVLVLFSVVLWALTGGGGFWPGWVIAFVVLRFGVRAHAVYRHPVRAD
jgi:hypothetical protein